MWGVTGIYLSPVPCRVHKVFIFIDKVVYILFILQHYNLSKMAGTNKKRPNIKKKTNNQNPQNHCSTWHHKWNVNMIILRL